MSRNKSFQTILVIGGDVNDSEIIRNLLKSYPIELVTCQEEGGSYHMAQRLQPDLILLDVCHPESNGFAICQLFKENRQTQDIPVIFIVAWEDTIEKKMKGFAVGGVDYVNKPFQRAELMARVAVHLKLSQARIQQNFLEQVEEEAHRHEERLKQAQHLARLGIWEWDIASDETTWSEEMFAMYGIQPEEFTGKGADYLDFTHPEDRHKQRHNIERAFENAADTQNRVEEAGPNPQEFRIVRPDGTICYVRGDAVAIVDGQGKPVRMLGILMDITSQTQMVNALKESEARFRNLVEGSIQGILVHRDTQPLFANAAFARILGYQTPAEILALPSAVLLIAPYERERLLGYHAARIKDKYAPNFYEYDAIRKDGSFITLQQIVTTIPWDGGTAVLGTIVDITERKKAEKALRESEARHRILFEQANDAIILTSEDDKILDVNRQACEMWGYSREELLTMSIPDLQAPEVRGRVGEVIKNELALFKGAPFESIDIRQDGTRIPVEVSTSLLVDQKDSRLALSIVRDISKRKHVELALLESETRLNGIIGSAMDAIIVIDEKHNIVLFNPTAEEVFAYQADEVLGQPLSILLPTRFRQAHEKHIHTFKRTGVTNRQMGKEVLYGLRANGTEFPLEASISQLTVNNGHFYTAILRDITQRKELEEQFYQAQKLEVVGLLAGGIAHDFNNLLTPIMMYSNLGMLAMPTDSRVYDYLEIIKETAERAKHLTHQILALSRKQVLAIEALQLNKIVTDFAKVMRHVIGEDITLQITLHDDLPLIQADQNQLGQVMMNLIVNARDAMPEGGTLKIETAVANLDNTAGGIPDVVPPGLYVVLRVADSGLGMDDKTKQHLFEPFYTTKGPDHGTGLGLATVYSIVKRHQGFIQFASSAGEGTTFHVYIPYSPKAIAAKETEDIQQSVPAVSGSGTIMIVEDEKTVRAPLVHALLLYGYHVLEATNGEEALQIAETNEGELHLLITDIIMTGMNGHELQQKLMKRSPAMKVLFISGYSGDAIERITLTKNVDLLQKPFSLQQFTRKIQDILGAA